MAATRKSEVLDTVDEDFICCKICLQQFDSPKILPCRHTFCEQCVAGLVDRAYLTCPECGLTYQVPKGGVSAIEPNIFMMEFSETVQQLLVIQAPEVAEIIDSRETTVYAEIKCEGCHENPATFGCSECKQSLCDNCVKVHRNLSATQTHSLTALSDTKKPSCPGMHETERKCSVHTRNEVQSYCKTCDNLVCSDCILKVCEAGHIHRDIEDTADEYRQQLTAIVDNLTLKQQDAEKNKTAAIQVYTELKERRQTDEHMVRMKAAEIIDKIKKEEKRLVDELITNYQMKISKANADITVLKLKQNNIKRICNEIKMLMQNGNAVKLLSTKGAIESELEKIRSNPLEMQKVIIEKDNLNEGMIMSLLTSAVTRDSSDKSDSQCKMKMSGALPAFSRTASRSTSTPSSKFEVNTYAQHSKDCTDVAKCQECRTDKLHGKFSQGAPNQTDKSTATSAVTVTRPHTREKFLSDQDGKAIATFEQSSGKDISKDGGKIKQPVGRSSAGQGQSALTTSPLLRGKDIPKSTSPWSRQYSDSRCSTATPISNTRRRVNQVDPQPRKLALQSSSQYAVSWACKRCSTCNTSDKVRCVKCDEDKPKSADKKGSLQVETSISSASVATPKAESKPAHAAIGFTGKDEQRRNTPWPDSVTTCLMTAKRNKPKPHAKQQFSHETTTKSSFLSKPSGFWICQTCSAVNPLAEAYCRSIACRADKP